MTPTQCLSADQVAELLACSRAHVYQLISDGVLPAIRVGRKLSVPVAVYEKFCADHMTGASS